MWHYKLTPRGAWYLLYKVIINSQNDKECRSSRLGSPRLRKSNKRNHQAYGTFWCINVCLVIFFIQELLFQKSFILWLEQRQEHSSMKDEGSILDWIRVWLLIKLRRLLDQQQIAIETSKVEAETSENTWEDLRNEGKQNNFSDIKSWIYRILNRGIFELCSKLLPFKKKRLLDQAQDSINFSKCQIF